MSIAAGPQAPKLLVADDEQPILDLLKRRLEALGCTVFTLAGGSRVVRTARDLMPDLILLDVMMPDLDGFSVCQALKADALVRDIPVIMMTARSEVDSRIKGLELGAHDYVPKPFEASELVARIRAALRVKQLQDELKEANRRLERLATSDPLTDLPNRRTFDEQFFLAVERSRRSGEALSVMMIDLDRFKRINDTYGHAAGDAVLVETARRFAEAIRRADLLARYGGEEFCLLLPDTDVLGAITMAARLRELLEAEPIAFQPGPREAPVAIEVRASIGIAIWQPELEGVGDLIALADRALYRAKSLGRDRVELAA